MNTTSLKGHLISAGITFVAIFSLVFFGALQSPTFTFDKKTIIATAIAAGVAGIRAIAKLIAEWAIGITTNPIPVPNTPIDPSTLSV